MIQLMLALCMSISAFAQSTEISVVNPDASDLSFMDALSHKKMVALGESGHAVAEFHRWRGHMARYMIENHGFRQVLVEEDILSGFNIVDALESCRRPEFDEDKVRKAFQNFDTATYRHNEFYSFYEFICQWNHSHPTDPVKLYGIDVWSNDWDIRKFLETEINQLPFENIKKIMGSAKDQCFLWSLDALNDYPTHPDWVYYGKYQKIEPKRNAECMASLYELNNELNKNSKEIVKLKGQYGWTKITTALDNGKTRQQIRDVYTFDFKEAMKLRDAGQARNTLNLLRLGGHKAPSILMAHNLHVYKNTSQVLPKEIVTSYPWAQVPSAGEWLDSYFGDDFATVGLGGYDLKSLRDGAYPIPTSQRSLDVKLNELNSPFLFVDVHQLDFLKDLKWWMHNETEPEGMWVRPRDQVDYYFFIQSSAPATLWKYSPPKH